MGKLEDISFRTGTPAFQIEPETEQNQISQTNQTYI
jgi:hypothetical protein